MLAVDIGSSSVKAGVFDALARSVTGVEATVPHAQTVASDGTSEEDADQIRIATEQAIDSVLAKAGVLAGEIIGVGFDCMSSTVVGVDANGNAITPVYTYADTRSAADVDRLKEELNVPVIDRNLLFSGEAVLTSGAISVETPRDERCYGARGMHQTRLFYGLKIWDLLFP